MTSAICFSTDVGTGSAADDLSGSRRTALITSSTVSGRQCHVSVTDSRSIWRSRQSSVTSSNLFNNDRIFRHPNVIVDRLTCGEQLMNVLQCCWCDDVVRGTPPRDVIPCRRTCIRCLCGRQSLYLKIVFLTGLVGVTSCRWNAHNSPEVYLIMGGQSPTTPSELNSRLNIPVSGI